MCIRDSQISFKISWSRNGFHVPELDNQTHIPKNLLSPGQSWSVSVLAFDPFGLSSLVSKSVVISNMPPEAIMNDISESLIPGSMTLFNASSSVDMDGTINSWIWTINNKEIYGMSFEIFLDSGQHDIKLTVIDNLGLSHTIQSIINVDTIYTVDNLIINLDGANINLEWSWNGPSTDFKIYRSTSPINSVIGLSPLDEYPEWGDSIPTPLTPIAFTSDKSWSEEAPVAAKVYYAVTTFSDGKEVVWISADNNMISIDASSAANSTYLNKSDNSSISIISSILLMFIGISSIGINLFLRRNRK